MISAANKAHAEIKSAARWGALWFFFGLWVVCYSSMFVTGALLEPIKLAFHLTDEQLGRLNTFYITSFVIMSPIAGLLGDKVRRRPLLWIGLVLQCVATIGSGTAGGFLNLCLWRALSGIGEAIFFGVSPSWIADLFAPKSRGLAFGIIVTSGQFAALASYAGGAWLSRHEGWGGAYIGAGIPVGLLSLGLFFIKEPRPGASDVSGPGQELRSHTLREAFALFRNVGFFAYISGYTFRLVSVGGLFFWGAQYLSRHYNVSNSSAVSFVGLSYVITGVPAMLIAGVVAGYLSTTVRGAYVSWLILGDLLAAFMVIGFLDIARNIHQAELFFLAEVFFAGLSWGVITPVLYEIVPLGLRNFASSIAMAAQNIGTALIASEVIGFVSDLYGIRIAFYIIPAAYLIGVAFWIALLLYQRRQPRFQSDFGQPLNADVELVS